MKTKALITAGVTAVVAASIIAQPVLAWHPKGVITKKAYNVTTNGPIKDANSAYDAVEAKPGDTIRYIIEVSNIAAPEQKQWNDMDFVVMTDNLPADVTPINGMRSIRENLGLIVPGKKVTKEYDVKVSEAATDGQVITNEACFTGDSVVRDNPQRGCDVAKVKVSVPEQPKPEQPKPEQPKPEAPKPETPAPEQPAALPQTGIGVAFGAVAGTSAMGYAAHAYLRSKRALGKAFRK